MEYEKSQSTTRGKGRGRGRGRKKAVENEAKVQEPVPINEEQSCTEQESVTLDLNADITQLEAPTFSTINKGPPEPMLRLQWDHKTHLIGEKVINPMIHCCDKCSFPILIYGRMIPCKHVFCFSCGEHDNKVCPRCQEKVVRVEKTGLGTVFMCTFGGTRYGSTGCRRTYLSQRDLQAHINHRHVSGSTLNKNNANTQPLSAMKQGGLLPTPNRLKTLSSAHHAAIGDPRVQNNTSNEYYKKSHSNANQSHQSLRQQSQHHAHHQDSHQHGIQHQHHGPAVSTAQQLLQTAEFANQLLASTYASGGSHSGNAGTAAGLRSNLIAVQIHDSNTDNASVGLAMPPNFTHQSFSPQFSQNSSGITQFNASQLSSLGPIPQSLSQFFSNNPSTNYNTQSSQRNANTSFNSNSQAQSMISQTMMGNTMSQQRRSQFPEPVMQPFSVPPPPRWHPAPNQTHFY